MLMTFLSHVSCRYVVNRLNVTSISNDWKGFTRSRDVKHVLLYLNPASAGRFDTF